MKKIISIVIAMAALSVSANAQSALKGLGSKAMQKVEKSVQKKVDQKVDKAIDGAVDKIFGVSGKSQNEGSAAQQEYSGRDNSTPAGYAESLLSESGNGWEWYGDEDDLPLLQGSTLKDMVGFMPEIPDAEVLVTEKGWKEFDKAVKTASKATSNAVSVCMSKMSSYSQSSQITGSYKENEKLEKLYEELVNIQQADAELMMARNQALASNLLGAFSGSSSQSLENGTIDGALNSLSVKMLKNWPKTDECKKINKLSEGKNNKKEMEAVIDAYNAKQMKKWIETIKLYQEQDKASVMRLISIEDELNAMSNADKANPYWSKCMIQLTQLFNKVMVYTMYPSRALSCPMVRYPEN